MSAVYMILEGNPRQETSKKPIHAKKPAGNRSLIIHAEKAVQMCP